jgi:hypothetical protein
MAMSTRRTGPPTPAVFEHTSVPNEVHITPTPTEWRNISRSYINDVATEIDEVLKLCSASHAFAVAQFAEQLERNEVPREVVERTSKL